MLFIPKLRPTFFPYPKDALKVIIFAAIDFLVVIPLFLLIIRTKSYKRMKKIGAALTIVNGMITYSLISQRGDSDLGGVGTELMFIFSFCLGACAIYLYSLDHRQTV